MSKSWPSKRGKKVFNNFHGMNTPTMVGSSLPRGPSLANGLGRAACSWLWQAHGNWLLHMTEPVGCKLPVWEKMAVVYPSFPLGVSSLIQEKGKKRRRGTGGPHSVPMPGVVHKVPNHGTCYGVCRSSERSMCVCVCGWVWVCVFPQSRTHVFLHLDIFPHFDVVELRILFLEME